MKIFIVMILAMWGISTAAQEVGRAETTHGDTLELASQSIPQTPFEELDSLLMNRIGDRYVVVYKDGRCGIYDLMKEVNVTRIRYESLRFLSRKEIEGDYYTFFSVKEGNCSGIISISEANNQFVVTTMPPKDVCRYE